MTAVFHHGSRRRSLGTSVQPRADPTDARAGPRRRATLVRRGAGRARGRRRRIRPDRATPLASEAGAGLRRRRARRPGGAARPGLRRPAQVLRVPALQRVLDVAGRHRAGDRRRPADPDRGAVAGRLRVGRARRLARARAARRPCATPTPARARRWTSSTRPSTGWPTTRPTTTRRSTSRPPSRPTATPGPRGAGAAQRRAGGGPMTRHACPTRPAAPTRVDDVFDRPASVRSLALLRLVLGPWCWSTCGRSWPRPSAGTTYDDTSGSVVGLHARVPAGCRSGWCGPARSPPSASTLGWRTRFVAPLTWLCVAGNLFLSQHHFRHNRAFLLFLLAAVALADSGRVLSLDARRRRARTGAAGRPGRRPGTVWPLWLLRVLAASVYLASGISKLVDPDWSSGLVLWDRAVRHQHLVHERVPEPIADVVVELVTARWVHTITSPIAVAMELFIGVGIWLGGTRLAAIWVAIFFHVSIELSASWRCSASPPSPRWPSGRRRRTRDRAVVVDRRHLGPAPRLARPLRGAGATRRGPGGDRPRRHRPHRRRRPVAPAGAGCRCCSPSSPSPAPSRRRARRERRQPHRAGPRRPGSSARP